MIIGNVRVSTTEQNLDLQRDALKRAGCEKIIEDTVSGPSAAENAVLTERHPDERPTTRGRRRAASRPLSRMESARENCAHRR
jgi:hypothetical protein